MSQIWNFIVGLFGYVMRFCYSISFGNYALALLFYALFFKILFIPFTIKQQKTQIKNAELRPKMAMIEKKYQGRNDKVTLQKKQDEMMQLQQEEGASALSGCLPLLLQFPIIIALFQIIREPLTYVSRIAGDAISSLANFLGVTVEGNAYYQMEMLGKITESNIDAVRGIIGEEALLPNLVSLGINFGETPSFQNPSLLLIIPFLVFITQFLTMRVSRKLMSPAQMPTAATPEATNVSNWIMDLAMPAMTLFFAFNFSGAIGLYWIYQSLISMLQTYILSKVMPLPTYTEEQLKAMQKAAAQRAAEARAAARNTSTARESRHYTEDDEPTPDLEYHSIYDEDPTYTPDSSAKKKKSTSSAVEKAPVKRDDK